MSSVLEEQTVTALDGDGAAAGSQRGTTEAASARISVVMPLFDKAPFVEAAIRSTLDNGPGVFEVIVIDDGSRDNSAEVVAAIDDPRIKLIRKANGGVSSARNVGLDHARGDWVAFLDADDFWLPGYVEALQTLIARYPRCGMVATRYVLQDDEGRRAGSPGASHFDEGVTLQVDDFYAAMAEGHFCCTCSVAIRRDVIREAQLRFPTGEQLGEDLDVTFRAGEFAPVGLDPRPLVVYRDSNLGLRLSRTVARKLLIPVFERLDARLASGQFPAALRAGAEHYLRNHLKYLIYYAVENGRRPEGWQLFRHRLIARRPRTMVQMALALILPAAALSFLRKLKDRRA